MAKKSIKKLSARRTSAPAVRPTKIESVRWIKDDNWGAGAAKVETAMKAKAAAIEEKDATFARKISLVCQKYVARDELAWSSAGWRADLMAEATHPQRSEYDLRGRGTVPAR